MTFSYLKITYKIQLFLDYNFSPSLSNQVPHKLYSTTFLQVLMTSSQKDVHKYTSHIKYIQLPKYQHSFINFNSKAFLELQFLKLLSNPFRYISLRLALCLHLLITLMFRNLQFLKFFPLIKCYLV